MKSEVLKNFPWTDLTAVGFFIFMGIFVFYVYWTMKKSNRKYIEDASRIPFKDEQLINKGFGHE